MNDEHASLLALGRESLNIFTIRQGCRGWLFEQAAEGEQVVFEEVVVKAVKLQGVQGEEKEKQGLRGVEIRDTCRLASDGG